MIDWEFEPTQSAKERIKPGEYRLRINAVRPKPENSESKNDYVTFCYDVSGEDAKAFSRLTFNPENRDMTNWIIELMAKTFNVPLYEVDVNDFSNWIGHEGAGLILNTRYFTNEIKRFIPPNEQDRLPAWVEGKPKSRKNTDWDGLPW